MFSPFTAGGGLSWREGSVTSGVYPICDSERKVIGWLRESSTRKVFGMITRQKRTLRKRSGAKKRYWSASVTRHSNALDLKSRVFTSGNPRRIALSLKRSAEVSRRRKGSPYQSAMSMLNFYVNRAGTKLTAKQKKTLHQAKPELRKAFARQ